MVMPPFIAPELFAAVDLATMQERLSSIVQASVLPRLILTHARPHATKGAEPNDLAQGSIERLAHLVLDPNIELSSAFIARLEEEGHSIDDLFVHLLEPAARCLGTMWDNDECSFVDVAFGVGRLQQLLSMFSSSHAMPDFSERRSVCMLTLSAEQHSLGGAMVESCLRAGGWAVRALHRASADEIAEIVAREWFAVAGLTVGSRGQFPELAATIAAIREHSCNPTIGVMVGGPPFIEEPENIAKVGADATAINAPAAVLVAQRLFDIGAVGSLREQKTAFSG